MMRAVARSVPGGWVQSNYQMREAHEFPKAGLLYSEQCAVIIHLPDRRVGVAACDSGPATLRARGGGKALRGESSARRSEFMDLLAGRLVELVADRARG